MLVATFLAVEATAYVTVASSARGLSRYLVQAAWQRRLNRLSGAIFADYRYEHVFIYHNGADSYYAARGFRGSLRV